MWPGRIRSLVRCHTDNGTWKGHLVGGEEKKDHCCPNAKIERIPLIGG